jgi:glyoxylase-like metal-dependent hydrolase (beta-lactamase superfamily II)/rhodanese-related sulfurtransferase
MLETSAGATQWTAAEVVRHLLGDSPSPFVVDVRNRDEFERWRLEGAQPLQTVHAPYFEILEKGGKDDLVDSVVAFAQAEWTDVLPKDRPILAVCAKGGTSDLVAEGLRRLGYDAANLAGGTKAYGDHQESRLALDGEVRVFQVMRPARGCLSHVLAARNGDAAVIDALRHTSAVESVLRDHGLRLKWVLDTHAHADHISGGRSLADKYGAPYYMHPYDGIHPFDMMPSRIDFEFLDDQFTLPLGGHAIRVMHVPGHTLGNTVLALEDLALFAGDSVFLRSIARPDLGGHAESWAKLHRKALAKISELPSDMAVLPGHFASLGEANGDGVFMGTVRGLRESNAGMRAALEGEDAFLDYIREGLGDIPKEYIEIKRVNLGLSSPNEDAAAELEMGKNICALADAYKDAEE